MGEITNYLRFRGQLGGCNVIFMESRTTPLQHNTNLEFQDIEQQHPLLEAMGWRMLDFDYVQPPNTDITKKVRMFDYTFGLPYAVLIQSFTGENDVFDGSGDSKNTNASTRRRYKLLSTSIYTKEIPTGHLGYNLLCAVSGLRLSQR